MTEQRSFCEEIGEFCAQFDLSGQGTKQREQVKYSELEKLQQEEATLREGSMK